MRFEMRCHVNRHLFWEVDWVAIQSVPGRSVVRSKQFQTSNQFVGLPTAVDALNIGDDVRYNNVAYGYSFANISKKIEVLITGVLKDFPIPDTTFYFNKGDKIRVGSFGINKNSDSKSVSYTHLRAHETDS